VTELASEEEITTADRHGTLASESSALMPSDSDITAVGSQTISVNRVFRVRTVVAGIVARARGLASSMSSNSA